MKNKTYKLQAVRDAQKTNYGDEKALKEMLIRQTIVLIKSLLTIQKENKQGE